MREIRPGFWVPDNREGCKWLFRGAPANAHKPTYELPDIMTSLKACKNFRVAIDGGAHVGGWSIYLKEHFRRVLAFEPAPDNFECLKRNVPEVEAYHGALTRSDVEEVRIVCGPRGKSVSWRVTDDAEVDTIGVRGYSIDGLNLPHLDLLKLDIEGHEHEALLGASETIQRCRPVVIIEETVDRSRRASALLVKWGMKLTKEWKNNRLFVWN